MVVDHRQFSILRINHDHSDLTTDEQGAQIVPDMKRAGEIDEPGETPVCHRTQFQSTGTHGPELPPTRLSRGHSVHRNNRFGELDCSGRRQGNAVKGRAPTTDRRVAPIAGMVMHNGHPGTVFVDHTQARREPRKRQRSVGRAVDGIDNGHQSRTGSEAALLAENPDIGGSEHAEHRFVSDKVRNVLIVAQARLAPVALIDEGVDHRIGSFVQDRENLVSVHLVNLAPCAPPARIRFVQSRKLQFRQYGRSPTRYAPSHGKLMAMAVVDLQGFVADLKDHVVEHGFHVHDERHFIETYTNRQIWEVDLHPEAACDGPLDMHVALEVGSRALIMFEDELLSLDEGDEVSSDIRLPLTISFALPPLPSAPDLLILATDLAGIGTTELPLEVSALDSFGAVTDAPVRAISIVARVQVELVRIFYGRDVLCDVLDRCSKVAEFLLDRAPAWIDEP